MARRFELVEGGSSKFWQVDVEGSVMTVTFGRIGTAGQAKDKAFESPAAAQREADKLVAEKTKKGYSEVSGEGAQPPERAPAAPKAAQAPTSAKPASAKTSATPVGAAKAPVPAPAEPSPSGVATHDAETREVGGERVRFSPPDWVRKLAQPTLRDKLAKKKAQPFAKVWEGVLAGVTEWDAGRYYRWKVRDARVEALVKRARERLAAGEPGPGFDAELEEVTYALSCMVQPGTPAWLERPTLALWHWIERAGPEVALATFLRARRWAFELGERARGYDLVLLPPDDAPESSAHGREISALRDALRAFGGEALGPIVREGGLGDDALVAWLLDDREGAARLWAETSEAGRPSLVRIATLLDDAAAVRVLFEHQWDDAALVSSVLSFGLELFELALSRAQGDPHSPRRWIPILACFPSVAAARVLVGMLEKKADRKLVGDALANMPAEAVVALREAQGKRLKHRDAIDSLVATLGAAAAAAEGGSAVSSAAPRGESVPEASSDALPRVLRSPPWRAKRSAREVVIEGLVARAVTREVDLSSIPARVLANDRENAARHRQRYTTAQLLEMLERGTRVYAHHLLVMPQEQLDALTSRGLLVKLDATYWTPDAYTPGLTVLLDRLGVGALDTLLALAPLVSPRLSVGLAYAGAVEVAPLALRWMAHKATRKGAEAWARRFPRHAAAGLVPLVLQRPGVERDRATHLLRVLDRAGHREALAAAAREHGAEVEAAIAELCARDPVELVPAKLPKLPDGLEGLPRVTLRGGAPLSDDAQRALVEMLSFSPLEVPYAGLDEVRAACDPRTLDALAEGLVRAWTAAGMPPAHEWMVRAVALVGTDSAARFLYERGRAWAADNARQRALLALDVLGAMGTDQALSLVGRSSRSAQRQYVKDRAAEVLAEVAAARGLSPDELEDRTAPDLGLDPHGTRVFDFGPRAFRVGFDEALRPFVRAFDPAAGCDTGERLASFPRAQKTDDADEAKAASEAWRELKAEVERVASDQLARLERMMSDERCVDADVFSSCFVRHPLVGHLARRLVWGAFVDGALVETFRVAEDGSLASSLDEPWALPDGARVGVVHPYALRDQPELLARWGQLFGDYQLLQPFEQLARTLPELPKAREGGLAARYSGKVAPSSLLYGLRRHGFRAVAEEGGIAGFSRDVGGMSVTLGLSPYLEQGRSAKHTLRLHVSAEGAPPSTIQLLELVRQLDAVVVE